LVLITPVLIALVFGLIQTGLVWNARHTVDAAAQHGARIARTSTALQPAIFASGLGTEDRQRIQTATLDYLRQIGGAHLDHPTVAVTFTDDVDGAFVTVTVSGDTVGVLPGTRVRVTATSRTALEGFRS
jgi:Flp pilus assembly protein TadG